MGGVAKALIRTATGATCLQSVVATARDAGVESALVVVGPPFGGAVAAAAAELAPTVVENTEPARGMASSVAVGFAALGDADDGLDGALLWPVDHPAVRVETVRAVIERGAPDRIAIPTHRGRGGHPTWFGRAVWPELADCGRARRGARSVIDACSNRVVRFAVNDPGVVADLDLPNQLPEASPV